jgi:hypothetical protein
MRGRTTLIVLTTLVVGIAAGIFLRSSGIVGPKVVVAAPLPPPPTPEGWNGLTAADRGTFYHLSEGGELFPLDWFLALEVESIGPDAQLQARPFMDNIERYGFLSDPKSSANPYGLPVGISWGRSKISGWEMMGLNCSACHVGQIQNGNRAVRIDGAGNMVLVNTMLNDMGAEVQRTLSSPRRLLRFWGRVRDIRKARRALIAQGGDSAAGPDESMLNRMTEMFTQNRGLLGARLNVLKNVPVLARSLNISVKEGYGRLDAFGVGRDEFFGNIAGNMLPADAPVSLPHIWGLMYTGWLQWGANTNSVMERNIGQALGVGALMDKNYNSTVRIDNLHRMEDLAYKLQPPVWPDFFPAIDQARAARGEKHFTEFCTPCHETWDQDGLMRSYKLHALDKVGTDPLTAIGFERPVLTPDGTVMPFAKAAVEPITKVKEKAYADMKLDAMAIAALEARQIRKGPQWDPSFRATLLDSEMWPDSKGRKVYRSKTLVGIWATAPFLHNGSVPTLFHLLKPAAERPVTFFTGQRDYDSVKLGIELDRTKFNLAPGLELFTFDTRIAGNWNTGHEWDFYPKLTDEIRYDIIEYIKTHTKPFDAPPKATTASLTAAGISGGTDIVFAAAAAPGSINWWPFLIGTLLVGAPLLLVARSLSANAAKYSATEAEDIQKIRDGVLTLQARLATDQDRPLRRGTHAKGRCVSGTFEVFDIASTIVDPMLSERLAQGLFAKPGKYEATVRFANGNSQIQRDKVGDVRACSFSVALPDGSRQDFSMNNATIFPINDAHAFAALIQVATASSMFKGFRSLKFGDKMAFLRIVFLGAIQQRPPKTAYQLTRYWSTVPFNHGPADAIKYSAIPCSGNSAHPLDGTANELQDELLRHVTDDEHMSAFDFGIQLLDTTRMRHWFRTRETRYWIENGSVEWKESQAPFHVVGRLTLVKGSAFSEEACEAQHIDVTEHSTPSSAPLGSLNRARWAAESASREARLGKQ